MKQLEIGVVIPTFNESKNIEELIYRVRKRIGNDSNIVVVDDNSADGTGVIVDKISKKLRDVHIIHRSRKEGRGSAIFEGFKFIAKFNPEYYIEMDADFSHKPEDIPKLLDAVCAGCDVAVGSRYLKKSKIINWSIERRIFSRLANFYIKFILKLDLCDCTNGFRIYSQKAIFYLLGSPMKTKGFIQLSEIAYKLQLAGFIFDEIPIVFKNRLRGGSNFGFKEITDAFLGVLKIRL